MNSRLDYGKAARGERRILAFNREDEISWKKDEG